MRKCSSDCCVGVCSQRRQRLADQTSQTGCSGLHPLLVAIAPHAYSWTKLLLLLLLLPPLLRMLRGCRATGNMLIRLSQYVSDLL